MPRIDVTTIYGAKSRQPIVEVTFPNRQSSVQLAINEARDLALNILQAAESAIQDAFLVEFFEELGMEPQERAALLAAFRRRRHDRKSDITA